MDIQTLGAALALAKKTVLPQTEAEDAGGVLIVGPDGAWVKGVPTYGEIAVDDTTLVAGGAEVDETVTGTTATITAEANHRYICTGNLTSLSFTPCETGLCEVVFHSTTADILTVTGGVMPDWWTATEAGYTYEMSFRDGYGVVMAWTTPS